MSKRTFRPQNKTDYNGPNSEQSLTQMPVAVYYRQSSLAQVGNISTTIQTIDMVAELERRGWERDKIILIDVDEGVSGTKRIDERQGMTHLFELIAERQIGSVACQDEDRLFRDITQIQVNIFIDICRKSDVKVITPFFTYDFAHPLQGEFHARQFRFKCDMAAEYLKSYVLGRLAPARQRLLREGRWAGACMQVGFMVDTQKHSPDGKENPNWRKYVPFEPYAEVVRKYFDIFLERGGAIREAMRQIRDQGVSFPTCEPPDGYKIHYQLKDRGGLIYVNRGSFVSLLTNPVYIGHWCYKGVVVQWNNHEPIVDVDTFMRAFNYLSKYTLTGDENEDYRPAYNHISPAKDIERPTERPLLMGLIHTQINDKWYRAGCAYEKKNSCYLYQQHRVEVDGTVLEWARRSTWIDDAVVSRFKRKLHVTFNSDAWMEAIQDTQKLMERERKVQRLQLTSLTEEMQNLVASLKTLTHPYLVQEVEQRYTQMEKERERLERELADIDHNQQKQATLEQAMTLFEQAASEWDMLTQDERRNVLTLFIERIEASEYDRTGKMRLLIFWRDGSQEEIQLWRKTRASHWSLENTEELLALFDSGANQLELAAAFPDLKWYQIFNEVKKHRGLVRFTPSWLGKNETYNDYQKSGGRKGKASGSRWREKELTTLKNMVERQASQLEIMEEFPYRRWIRIQDRIRRIFGKGTRVPNSGISQDLTYDEYVQQQNTVDDDASSGIVNRYYGSRRGHVRGFLELPHLAAPPP